MRKLIANIATYGVGDVLAKVAAFITLPIYTHLLNTAEFGLWNTIVTANGLVFIVLGLGSNVVYMRYFFSAKTHAETQLLTSTWFGFLAVWSTVIVLISIPFSGAFAHLLTGDSSSDFLLTLSLLSLPMSLVNSLCAQVLVNQFRARAAVALNVFTMVLVICLNIVEVIQFGVLGFFLAALLSNFILLVIRLWTVRDLLRFRFSFKLLRELLAFGIPLVPSSLAFWVFMSSDRALLSNLASLAQVGIYALANQVANVMNLLMNGLQQAWTPQAFQVYETQPEIASQLYGRVFSYILIVFSLFAVVLTAASEKLIGILAAPEYYPATRAVGPLALSYVFYATAQVTYLGITIKKKTRELAVLPWIAATANIVLNVVLIPHFGYMATAWSTAISYALLTFSYSVASQPVVPVNYNIRRTAVIITLTFVFICLMPYVTQVNLPLDVAVKSGIILIYILLMIAFKGIDPEDIQAMMSVWRRARARFGW